MPGLARIAFGSVDFGVESGIADEQSGGSATTVDGKMVDKPVVQRARLIVADADRASGG